MLPEADVELVRRWAEAMIEPELRDRIHVDVEVSADALTIVECSWMGDQWLRVESARLEWSESTGLWTLSCFSDEQPRDYPNARPTRHVRVLLDEIQDDPTFIFWG